MEPRNLGHDVLLHYRNLFKIAVARGDLMPLNIPYTLTGTLILPVVWLSIPHRSRPWLFRMRWLVMAVVIFFSLHIISVTSSTNTAMAYAAGLIGSWACIMNANLLFWTRPQWDAARVMRRKKRKGARGEAANGGANQSKEGNGHATSPTENGQSLRQRAPPKANEEKTSKDSVQHHEGPEFEYYWQPFPEDGTFFQRFLWAADLSVSFRGNGWNTCISSIPHPKAPADMSKSDLVDISSIPLLTPAGYRIPATEAEFFRSRLVTLAGLYLLLDFLSVSMMKDPYFVLGPERPGHPESRHPPLPAYLRWLSPWQLLLYREVFSLTGFVAAIISLLKLNDLLQFSFAKLLWPHKFYLWGYASAFGSFARVLDHGLAGWWGSWWHQTFRLQFMAPASYVAEKGWVAKGSKAGSAVALFCSFLQSGLLHLPGGITSLRETEPRQALAFFVLQAVGISIQREVGGWLCRVLPRALLHRRVVQGGNLAFTLVFLYNTAPLFCDEIAMAGLWMFEPVPFSPLRLMGFGLPGDTAWRWDRDLFPRWYTGNRWWQSGLGL